ncbi:unnamed protein product [Plutella xylostella]|uniref:(diamondback moth) hypothetical protein n=1 Tax=Plutella xylostella TaxID=51655 RepID=A0A8S4DWX1_PLUXY|nr:unnamed protein product [Plutella xylostella]
MGVVKKKEKKVKQVNANGNKKDDKVKKKRKVSCLQCIKPGDDVRPVSLRAWAAQAPAWRLPHRWGKSSRLPQAEDDTRARYLFLFCTSL